MGASTYDVYWGKVPKLYKHYVYHCHSILTIQLRYMIDKFSNTHLRTHAILYGSTPSLGFRLWESVYPGLTFTSGFHPGCGIDSISKQTVSGHAQTYHTSHTWSWQHKTQSNRSLNIIVFAKGEADWRPHAQSIFVLFQTSNC